MYMKLEKLLAGKLDSDQSDEVFEFYSDDFVKDDLLAQLDAFRANYSFDEYATIHDIILIVQDVTWSKSSIQRSYKAYYWFFLLQML